MNIKPKLRDAARFAIMSAYVDHAHTLKQAVKEFGEHFCLTESCLNCVHFKEDTELCTKYQARPPARVIAFGCPDYSDEDTIPF